MMMIMMKLFEMYARSLAALSQIIRRSKSEIARLRKSEKVNESLKKNRSRQRTTTQDKYTVKKKRERHHGKNPDGSSSATYHEKKKAVNCNRYKLFFKKMFGSTYSCEKLFPLTLSIWEGPKRPFKQKMVAVRKVRKSLLNFHPILLNCDCFHIHDSLSFLE
ncbi:hypothetical protein AVEN_134096-1 [Araneus ventricosus]|uniref:Uncharacterized protein n=1 Tax=Araneus ventricosus TaxID=182803 RepID=A0A4Y1ZYM1_ARAVE|nr:hypothetical protein AVEN_275292-1 [Araneus ventricosus]GBL72187.1 hypothetical protein AVEN_42023-1 [Araneus ventricosus]GBL72194.1 hypothetical protein AVEN_44598-1 [Araneus ventricosus]GBL72219.1 hypothetical protein AVEN_134096-1 [Araneus ventricosus]